jgi:transcriptional regulator with GAF, ATPase, and Fis domain
MNSAIGGVLKITSLFPKVTTEMMEEIAHSSGQQILLSKVRELEASIDKMQEEIGVLTETQPATGLIKRLRLQVEELRHQLEKIPHNTVQAISRSRLTLQQLEKSYIIEVLELTNWRVSGERGAAKILGLNSKTLDSKMRKLKIIRPGRNSSI